MQIVILAGGEGTRLRPLTYTRPKPLIPLLNRSLVEHIVSALPKEVDEVILAVSYMKDMVEEYVQKRELGWIVVEEKEPRGTGGAIKNVEKYLDDDFLVLNGDVISSLDISSFLNFHRKKGGIGAISLWEVKDPSAYGMVEIDDESRIILFKEKPKKKEITSNLINAGAYVLKPAILDYIEPNKKVSIEREIFPFVIENGLYGYCFKGFWVDVGRRETYLKANKILLDRMENRLRIDRNVNFKKANIKKPVLIGNNSTIDGKIGPYTTIGKNVLIGENCEISNAVIFNNTKIEADCMIKNCIIGEKCSILEHTILNKKMIGDNSIVNADSY